MTSFWAIVRVTARQLCGRNRMVGFTVLALVPAGLILLAARAREGTGVETGIDTDLGSLIATPFFAIVLPLTTLIFAGAALGDERRDKTLSFLVLRPVSRLQIVLAKTVATCGVSMGFALLSTITLTVAYVAVGGHINVLPAIFGGAAVVCLLYGSMFVLLGNLIARPTLVGVGYVLFIEQVLVYELPRLSPLSPWRVGLAATIDLMPRGFPARAQLGAIGELAPSAPLALLATAITVVISVGICTALLKRTDSV